MFNPDYLWRKWCARIERLDAALETGDDMPLTQLDLREQIDTLHWFPFMLDEFELE